MKLWTLVGLESSTEQLEYKEMESFFLFPTDFWNQLLNI